MSNENPIPVGDAVASLSSVALLRRRARTNLLEGPVTLGYRANRKCVLELLNEALATELVCVLRYKRHHFMAKGILAEPIAAEFAAHAIDEMAHADRIAARIVQLGGEPDFAPDQLTTKSHAEYGDSQTLHDMITDNLVAERVAIESYLEFIQYLGDKDPTTTRMLQEILAMEEEHANDLAGVLEHMPPWAGAGSAPETGSASPVAEHSHT